MSESFGSSGGFLVPPGFADDIKRGAWGIIKAERTYYKRRGPISLRFQWIRRVLWRVLWGGKPEGEWRAIA